MKITTAQSVAAAFKTIGIQSLVCHNLPLGENGYYVLYTTQDRPIEDMHRFDCDEVSDEAVGSKLLAL
jgi:hypothetical protein